MLLMISPSPFLPIIDLERVPGKLPHRCVHGLVVILTTPTILIISGIIRVLLLILLLILLLLLLLLLLFVLFVLDHFDDVVCKSKYIIFRFTIDHFEHQSIGTKIMKMDINKILKQLVAQYKRRNISVLLVGHRRSLLRALSTDLGLRCYLDVSQGGFIGADIPKHFAVSVDSLATMLHPARNKFDVVLIDESEQVFSHLISDTIETEKRRKCYLLLQHYVHVAKRVVALDADLNHITLHAIQRFGSKNPLSDRRFILNDYKFPAKSVEMYANDNHLVGDLFTSLREGNRIFVCANSKQRIDALVLAIQDEFGTDFPLFWVTSENSGNDDVSHFISNIKTEILKPIVTGKQIGRAHV